MNDFQKESEAINLILRKELSPEALAIADKIDTQIRHAASRQTNGVSESAGRNQDSKSFSGTESLWNGSNPDFQKKPELKGFTEKPPTVSNDPFLSFSPESIAALTPKPVPTYFINPMRANENKTALDGIQEWAKQNWQPALLTTGLSLAGAYLIHQFYIKNADEKSKASLKTSSKRKALSGSNEKEESENQKHSGWRNLGYALLGSFCSGFAGKYLGGYSFVPGVPMLLYGIQKRNYLLIGGGANLCIWSALNSSMNQVSQPPIAPTSPVLPSPTPNTKAPATTEIPVPLTPTSPSTDTMLAGLERKAPVSYKPLTPSPAQNKQIDLELEDDENDFNNSY